MFIAGTGSKSKQLGNDKNDRVSSNSDFSPTSPTSALPYLPTKSSIFNTEIKNGSSILMSAPSQVRGQASAPLKPIGTRQKAKVNRFNLQSMRSILRSPAIVTRCGRWTTWLKKNNK